MHTGNKGGRASVPKEIFAGGGELGALMRALDWANTPLGAVEQWPVSLRITIRILLGSGYPMAIAWGPQYTLLYNDAYRPILGKTKHPAALGRPTQQVFPEAWDFIGPLFDQVLRQGEDATILSDQLFLLDRNEYLEECYYTFSYSPVPDDGGGVGGVLVTALETTDRVVETRRRRTLSDLSARLAGASSEQEVCEAAAAVLGENRHSVPFALLYLRETGRHLRLAAACGSRPGQPISPEQIEDLDQPWPLREAARKNSGLLLQDLRQRFRELPETIWGTPPTSALLLPIHLPGQEEAAAYLIAGINPRRAFDEVYRNFLQRAAEQVGTSMARVRAYQQERRRAEALAEIDRAKTLFFTNISHEFRTPLTLMLGPVENMLQEARQAQAAGQREQLEIVHRNSLRLLKLVNTLLDFSRIEAGRVQAVYEPTDLTSFTEQLAGVFRSAMEKAGLRFQVECQPLPEPAYVDRDMWEKIVLNLLSNAFKFTFEGGVRVSLKAADGRAELTVQDTGAGIPEAELPRIFERFHRVEGARGRTYEGTGIGLALVSELVKLHSGTVGVESVLGHGSTFTVSIPLGKAHLPQARIAAWASRGGAVRSDAYVEDALSWLPLQSGASASEAEAQAATPNAAEQDARGRPLVLLADDNSDLRAYVTRLLSQKYRVHAVANGEQALAAARQLRPELVLSDIMMPGMDGFAVLKAIRENARTRGIPVILLSARAGEESRVEGLHAGADDYLVKPFTARELMARVEAHIRMAQVRRQVSHLEKRLRAESEEEQRRIRELLQTAPAAIAMLQGPEHVWTYVNPAYLEAVGRRSPQELLGKPIRRTLTEVEGQGFFELLDRVYQTGEPYSGTEAQVRLNRGPGGQPADAYFNFLYHPLKDPAGKVEGIFVHAVDVTPQVKARAAIEQSEQQFRMLAESIPQLDWMANPDGWIYWYNQRWYEYTGTTPEQMLGWGWQSVPDPEVLPQVMERWQASLRTGEPFEMVFPLRGADGMFRPFLTRIVPVRDAEGKVVRWFGTSTDITVQQRAEEARRKSEERLRAALAASDTGTYRWKPSSGEFVEFDESLERLFGLPPGQPVRTTEEFLQRIHRDDVGRVEEHIERSRRGADIEMEYRVVLPGGGVRWLLDRGKMTFEGGSPAYLVGACTDITSRKEEESARLKLAAIVESSDDAIVSKNLNGIIASWNAAAERIFGYKSEEMIGQSILKIIPPELHDDETEILSKLRRGERIDHFETVRLTKWGERIDVSLTISPVRDERGRVIGAAKIARDITQHKKTEEALRMSDKLATTGRLAATVAHEINNPLESVVNLVYLAKSQPGLPENVREYLRAAEEELDRVSQLTRQALGFYREKTAATAVRVAPILSQLRTVFSPKTTNKRIDLRLEVEGDPEIVAVPGELRQLFANLLSNSIDAVPLDGTIRVRVSEARQFDGAGRPGTRVTIADSGPGIDLAHRSRIFEPFFTTKKELGTGLGLWVSKGIVERHGGNIRLRSRTTPGCSGAVFSVFLPAKAAETQRRTSVLKEAV